MKTKLPTAPSMRQVTDAWELWRGAALRTGKAAEGYIKSVEASSLQGSDEYAKRFRLLSDAVQRMKQRREEYRELQRRFNRAETRNQQLKFGKTP